MKARKYDKRVEIKTVILISDGAAGLVPSSTTTNTTRWAQVKSMSQTTLSQLKTDYGLDDNTEALAFTFRKFTLNRARSVLVYKGREYRPLVAQDTDQYEIDLTVIGTRI